MQKLCCYLKLVWECVSFELLAFRSLHWLPLILALDKTQGIMVNTI